MNVMARLDESGLHITEIGMRIREIAKDGVTPEELAELEQLTEDLLTEGEVVEDVALDVEEARQVLRIGRRRAPNRELSKKISDFETSAARLRGKKIAPVSPSAA